MKEVCIDIKEIANGLGREDLLKIIAACYAECEYGYDVCDMESELENIDDLVDDDPEEDFLTAIQNTLANCDREFDDEYEEEDEDFPSDEEEDDYYDEDEEYDEEYDDEYDDECDCGSCESCTQRKIEENRRRNEEYLGL